MQRQFQAKDNMKDFLENFRSRPDGITTLVDTLCSFIKDEISFGRIKGGERFPTIGEIAERTGLTYYKARSVVERLENEGYVHSRPRIGTVVISRNKKLRGRVCVAYPDADICRFYSTHLLDIINRKLTTAGYAVSVVSFPIDADGSIAHIRDELLRATDLVIALRATSAVQRCLAESGVNHIFAYGNKPMEDGSPWIQASVKKALMQFANHCVKSGVKNVGQVRFEGNELFDAGPFLAKRGISSSWLTVSRSSSGRRRFDGIARCAYEMFKAMPRRSMPDLLLFWNSFLAQGAMMAFLASGMRIPNDVKVVSISETGFGPIYIKPITRLENDPVDAGEKIADFALTVLAKGRIPPPPQIALQYIFGETFPFCNEGE